MTAAVLAGSSDPCRTPSEGELTVFVKIEIGRFKMYGLVVYGVSTGLCSRHRTLTSERLAQNWKPLPSSRCPQRLACSSPWVCVFRHFPRSQSHRQGLLGGTFST